MIGFGAGSIFVSSWLHGQNAEPAQPAPLAARPINSYRDIVKQVLPAVVSIETHAKNKTAVRPNQALPFDDSKVPDEFRRFFDEFRRAPVNPGEPQRLGFGSGFLVDPAGVVVTNYHVVDGADTATVRLEDGRKFTSKTIHVDRRTDLAVIVLDVKDKEARFPFLEFGDSDAMHIGDSVLAVGAPFGLAGSVTHGIVSAKGRNGLHMNMYEDFLQTDAAINPGNSGGFQGVGLAVASNLAKNVVQSLRTTGTVQRGYLGVQIRELDPDVGARLGVPKETGVVVAQVYDNTPASKGGLQSGDIITSIAGKTIKDGKMLQSIIAGLPLNKEVTTAIVRDGKQMQLNISIEGQPESFGFESGVPAPRTQSSTANAVSLDKLGIEVADLSESMANDFGYRKGVQGVMVTRVQDNSVASASLRRGMVISKIDNQVVTNTATARQAMEKADVARGVVLQVASPQGGVNYVLLRSTGSGS